MKNVGVLPVHDLANIYPLATIEELARLVNGIRDLGQLEPIILYRGKIIDGRCRALACLEIGIDVIKTELPHKMPLKEVSEMVTSLSNRRNLTLTQKIIIALRSPLCDTITAKKLAIHNGVTERDIRDGLMLRKYLSGDRYDKITELLFNGKKVKYQVTHDDGVVTEKSSSSVSVLSRAYKKSEEDEVIDTDAMLIVPDADITELLSEKEKEVYAKTNAMMNKKKAAKDGDVVVSEKSLNRLIAQYSKAIVIKNKEIDFE